MALRIYLNLYWTSLLNIKAHERETHVPLPAIYSHDDLLYRSFIQTFLPLTIAFFQLDKFAWVFGECVLVLFSTTNWNLSGTPSVIFTLILFATSLSLTNLSFSPPALFQTSRSLTCFYGWYITGLISIFKNQCSQEKHQGWQPDEPRRLFNMVVWECRSGIPS